MHSQPLSLHHHPLFHDRLRAIEIPISEYSFPNLYLFRETHRYEVIKDGDEIWIRGRSYDGHAYLMPTRDVRKMDPEYLSRITGTADPGLILPRRKAMSKKRYRPEDSTRDFHPDTLSLRYPDT